METTLNTIKENTIDTNLFKKLMYKTALTMPDASDRIKEFQGGEMFVHYQYHDVKPNGNSDDRKTYRIHQSQYWLSDARLSSLGKPGEEVNITLITIKDITNSINVMDLGTAYVDTKVFLNELKVAFETIKKIS